MIKKYFFCLLAETNSEPKKAPEEIRIKTLEEIKQEKAAKSQLKEGPSVETSNTKTSKGVKRAITVKDNSVSHIKTFSEILHAKKNRQEEQQEQNPSPKRAKNSVESDTAAVGPEATNLGEVRVKTLEEIRREKAARIQAQQPVEPENKKNCGNEENGDKKPRLLRIKKLVSQSKKSLFTIFFSYCCC